MFSDLPPKADIDRRDGYVCFVPEAAVSRCSREPLLDHLVGTLLEKERHVEAERPGGLEVDHQLELDRGLDGKIARLRALEDAIGAGDNPGRRFRGLAQAWVSEAAARRLGLSAQLESFACFAFACPC